MTGTALDVAQSALGLALLGVEGFTLPHWLLWGGVIAALPTVAAGLADFASLPRAVQDSRPLRRHMLCMGTAFTLFLVAALWRVKAGAFAAPPPSAVLLIEILGVVALFVGGHAGGRVVFEEIPRAGTGDAGRGDVG